LTFVGEITVLASPRGSLSSAVVIVLATSVGAIGFALVDLSLGGTLGFGLEVGSVELLVVIDLIKLLEALRPVGTMGDLASLGGLTGEETLIEGSSTINGVKSTETVTTVSAVGLGGVRVSGLGRGSSESESNSGFHSNLQYIINKAE